MRLVELTYPNYVPLIHDILKNTTILLVIEVLQFFLLKDPILDKVFLTMLGFTLVGNIFYYLIVDRLVVGAGPILSGQVSITSDKQE